MNYIKSEEEFLNCFSKKLYDKIVKESTIKINRKINRDDFKSIILQLYNDLNNYDYKVGIIEEMIYTYKTNDVARLLPVFSIKDEILYYFLCKMLEENIAIDRTPNTFGAWRMGNLIKLEENVEIEYVYKSYNPLLWNDNWKQFQNLINSNIKMCDDNAVILKLDIANFYDNINLSLLEKKLLASVPSDKLEYVNMLMYFLRNWNLKNDKYHIKTVGIPQNEFGDQSRLLANFYLQSYDKKIKEICDKIDAVYLRFADDQIIFLNDKNRLNELLYVISKELNNIGLNLNASKVKKFNKEMLKIFYGIPIFELIDDKKFDEAAIKFFEYFYNKDVEFNYNSSLKRFLNIGLDKVSIFNRNKLKAIITSDNFVKEGNEYYFKRIYNNISNEERKDFINLIYKMSEEITYNCFHYNAINFLNSIKVTDKVEDILDRIQHIKEL